MDVIICPQCRHENPLEAFVCEQCNANLKPVKSIIDTANSHYNEALSLAHEGKLDEAIGQLDAAIALSSQNAVYFNLLGTIQAQKGLFSEAIHAWEQCLNLNPEMETAHQNIEKARRMEEIRAEDFEEQPQKVNSLLIAAAACVFLLTTIFGGISSYMKSNRITTLTNDLMAIQKESSSWKSQFESLTAQFPQEGINGVLKKLTQNETLIADRDKRIEALELKIERASSNYKERMDGFRLKLQESQQEKNQMATELKMIDSLKEIIVNNETQIDLLQENITSLKEQLDLANKRIETHRKNLLLAQDNLRDIKENRDRILESSRKINEKSIQELRSQILEQRDEIAIWQRKSTDQQYADTLVIEALDHLNNNKFNLVQQNIETALERSPGHLVALYLQELIAKILDDPLEQEIRRLETIERNTRREEIKTKLIAFNLEKTRKHYDSGNFSQSINLAQRTLDLEPQNAKDIQKLHSLISQSEERNKEIVLSLIKVRKDIKLKKYKEANALLQQVLKYAPSHDEAIELLKEIPR